MESREFLETKLQEDYDRVTKKQILEGLVPKKTTLRINTRKTTKEKIEEILEKNHLNYQTVPWNKDGIVLETEAEETLKKLEIYQQGEIYLQNLSSQIPPFIVDAKKQELVLDMAASPGSKTTEMFNLSNGEALITAVEKDKLRSERLKYNLFHQGATKVSVLVMDARNLSEDLKFDKVLLDAPCSGSGTLKNSDIEQSGFSKELVEKSIHRERTLLKKAIAIVKKGGEITYSTCSILKCENEEIIQEALKTNQVEIIPIEKDFSPAKLLPTTIEGTICVCPDETYEGFFVAHLRKK